MFISLATFLGVRVMHFQRKEFVDKNRETQVRKYIVLIAILTMCPAVYLTVGIVQDTFFESAANRFVNEMCIRDRISGMPRLFPLANRVTY